MNLKKKLELNKIGNILIYLSQNTNFFGVTKANKLFYYIDCFHLLKYGRTVTREIYKKLPQGPVPSELYDRIKSIIELNNQDNEEIYVDDLRDFNEYLAGFIAIRTEEIPDGRKRHTIIAKREFEEKWFSESELSVIKEVAATFKDTNAKELTEKTHKEKPYLSTEENNKIDLKIYVKDKISAEQYAEIEHIEKTTDSMLINYG